MRFDLSQLIAASALTAAFTSPMLAQTFTFRLDSEGADTKWENADNWFDETNGTNDNLVVPQNTAGEPGTNFNVAVRNNGTVDFDDVTSLTLAGATDAAVFIDRFFLGAPGSGSGDGTLNVSGGHLNSSRSGAGIVATIGRGQDGTLNISGGIMDVGQRMLVGSANNGHGLIDLSGGELNIYRGGNSSIMSATDIAAYGRPSLDLGADDGTDPASTTTGIVNISGGSFTTRVGVAIDSRGTFDVQGSGATEIGIGSNQSIDGYWLQYDGGTLRAGVDAGGITPILIDDVDDDGQGDVKFYSGSILDPYDLGGAAANVWHTVMTWDGTLQNNNLALSSTAITDGWSMQIDGNALQVMLAGSSSLVGDYNGDGFVSQGDLDLVLLNWGNAVAPAGFDESNLEGGGPFDSLMSQNELDGVLLNWGNGTPPSVAAVPEPTSLALIGLGGLALAGRRRRK